MSHARHGRGETELLWWQRRGFLSAAAEGREGVHDGHGLMEPKPHPLERARR